MLRRLADLSFEHPPVPMLVDESQSDEDTCDSGVTPCLISVVVARNELRNIKRLYEDFERDILLPLLLGEIALHNLGVREGCRGVPEVSEEAAGGLACTLRPCNAYSVAAATGLPRETVRRKITRLVELGWLNRRNNGHLYISSAALKHFGALLRSRELPELLEAADMVRSLSSNRTRKGSAQASRLS